MNFGQAQSRDVADALWKTTGAKGEPAGLQECNWSHD